MPPKKHIIIIGVLCVISLGLGYWYGMPKEEGSGGGGGNGGDGKKEPEFLKKGLVAYYPFNGDAKDESNNLNHFTVNGATLTKDRHGNPDRAYAFDGVNAYMEAPNHPSLQLTQFTLSVWINPTSRQQGAVNPILLKDRHGPAGENFGLWFGVGNKVGIQLYDEGASRVGLTSEKSIALDSHTMCVVTAAKQNLKIYIDGELDGTLEFNSVPSIDQHPLFLSYDGSGYYPKFNGIIDDVRIYNRALTEAEVKELYEFEKAN